MERVDLVKRADSAARAADPRIFQVQASYVDNLRHVMIATSDGVLNFDRQPLARMGVAALAREGNGMPQRGYAGGGGRVALDFFLNDKTPEHFARASRPAGDRSIGGDSRARGRDDGRARSRLAGHPAA